MKKIIKVDLMGAWFESWVLWTLKCLLKVNQIWSQNSEK